MMETKNPLVGVRGVFNLLAFHLRDAQLQCSCLEYLVQYGGDLRVQSFSRETTRDIAVRMRKMKIVTLIENYCEWSLVETDHGLKLNIIVLLQMTFKPHHLAMPSKLDRCVCI